MRLLPVLLLLLVAGCTLMPNETDELPAGVTDPKEDLVAQIKDHPDDLDSHADLLRLQIKDGDAVGAQTTVSHALKFNGQDYRAHLLAAQYHRWQGDLISAEKSLLTARDLGPERLEPRVALSGLYNQTYLEDEELEQRRVTLDLAGPDLRPEFLLDYAYACSDLGRDDDARSAATELLADTKAPAGRRSRAEVLLCELSLRKELENESITHLLNAYKLQPDYEGVVQYAARLVTAVKDGKALKPIFEQTLESQDRVEMRWAALFGHWMLAVQSAVAADKDPLVEDVDSWFQRLDAVSPAHPDTLTRRYQLLALDPAREAELKATEERLKASDFGAPPAPGSLKAVIRLWRAEDALRLNAPGITLAELTQLEVREPKLDGMRIMRTMALFKARDNEKCLGSIDAWLSEESEDSEFLLAMRWWILLREGKSLEVLNELRKRDDKPTNASLWIESVAKFHVYRATGEVPPDNG
ncbi:MAG: hypothetical protein KDB90_11050 [Planctomycetes bacterium]|nr:hypothetical protein [Planctomycetota bacterium]